MAAASFAIQVVSTLAQQEEQKNAAARQEQMIQDGIAKERAATARQYEEINQVAQDESAQRYKEYLIDSARLKAIGAESGLAGATQDRVEQEAQNNASTDIATIEANRQRQTEAAHTQGVAKQSQANVQLSSIRRPSALGTGLQIAGAGVSSYLQYDPKLRNLNPNTQSMEEINAIMAANKGAKR